MYVMNVGGVLVVVVVGVVVVVHGGCLLGSLVAMVFADWLAAGLAGLVCRRAGEMGAGWVGVGYGLWADGGGR